MTIDYSKIHLTGGSQHELWKISRPCDWRWLPPGWDDPQRVAWRQERFEQALETIDAAAEHDLWMQLRFAQLGTPKFQALPMPTTAVGLRPNGQIEYVFHPRFFDLCEPERLVFSIVHERFHVDLDHLRRGIGKRRNLWNIVIDIVDNEYCHALGFLPPEIGRDYWSIEKLLPGFRGLGEDVGAVADFRTEFDATRLYDFLLSIIEKITLPPFAAFAMDIGIGMPIPDEDADDDESIPGPGGSDEGEGEEDDDEGNDLGPPISWSDVEEDPQDHNDYQDDVAANGGANPFGGGGGGAGKGRGTFGDSIMPAVAKSRSHTWLDNLADRVHGEVVRRVEKQWAIPPRRLVGSGLYPHVLLPSVRRTIVRTKSVVLIGDCSGSMAGVIPKMLRLFSEMIDHFTSGHIQRNPVKVDSYAFDDGVYHWPKELIQRGRAPHSGGTNFQRVANFVEGRDVTLESGHGGAGIRLRQHPDLVIVVTDGEDRAPKIKYPDNWVWLCVEEQEYPAYVRRDTKGIGQVVMYGDVYDGSF